MTTKQLPVRLDAEDYEALKTLAFFADTSMNALISGLVHGLVTNDDGTAIVAAATTRFRQKHSVALEKLSHL